jgi:hypothetical protein
MNKTVDPLALVCYRAAQVKNEQQLPWFQSTASRCLNALSARPGEPRSFMARNQVIQRRFFFPTEGLSNFGLDSPRLSTLRR